MHSPHSLDVLSPKVNKTPSDNQINFPSISNDSLIIHPEDEAANYPELTEILPEVDEDTIYEESDLAAIPNFFQHLSLRFYGHESETPVGIEGRRCSEPAIKIGIRELVFQDDSLTEAEKDKRLRFYQVRSQTDLESPHLDPRRKGSNQIKFMLNEQLTYSRGDDSEDLEKSRGSKTCTAAQSSLKKGSMDARDRFLLLKDDQGKIKGFQVANKRVINKSGGPESIKGIINDSYRKRFSKGSPSFGLNNKLRLSQTSQGSKPGELGAPQTSKKIMNPLYSSTRKDVSSHFKSIQASMAGNFSSFAGRRLKVAKNL